jgi:uncharacterized protein (TIGR04255 family)
MPLDLPAADKTQLAHAPLELVICQVKFDETVAISDSRTILDVHTRLGGRAGQLSKVQESQVQVMEVPMGPAGPAGLPTTKTHRGWQLASDDGTWTATLLPDSLALQTTAFTSWKEDFGPRLHDLIDAVAEAAKPSMEQRIGVRYVDRIAIPDVHVPGEWDSWIAPELLGPILHARLGPGVRTIMQQVDLDVADDVRCTLRHGAMPDPNRRGMYQYILDADVFREGLRGFSSADVRAAADDFHDAAVKIFQQAITPKLLHRLRGSK